MKTDAGELLKVARGLVSARPVLTEEGKKFLRKVKSELKGWRADHKKKNLYEWFHSFGPKGPDRTDLGKVGERRLQQLMSKYNVEDIGTLADAIEASRKEKMDELLVQAESMKRLAPSMGIPEDSIVYGVAGHDDSVHFTVRHTNRLVNMR